MLTFENSFLEKLKKSLSITLLPKLSLRLLLLAIFGIVLTACQTNNESSTQTNQSSTQTNNKPNIHTSNELSVKEASAHTSNKPSYTANKPTNEANKNTKYFTNDTKVLEVTGIYKKESSDSSNNVYSIKNTNHFDVNTKSYDVDLMSLDYDQRFQTVIDFRNVSEAVLNTIVGDNLHILIGDYVEVTGDFTKTWPVNIVNITSLKKVANPKKQACESMDGQVWRPEGKAQIPTCVAVYNDGGKACTSSNECEGDCMVQANIETATCASSSSRFGCGATIENFKRNGSIMCVD